MVYFQVAKEFFPDVAIGFNDPRVNLRIGDGMVKLEVSSQNFVDSSALCGIASYVRQTKNSSVIAELHRSLPSLQGWHFYERFQRVHMMRS